MDTLRQWRRRRGWTQTELAKAAGIGLDTVSNVESGKHQAQPRTLRKLARALDLEVADLFEGPDSLKDQAPAADRVRALSPEAVRRLLKSGYGEDWSAGGILEARAVADRLEVTREELLNLLVEIRPLEARRLLVGSDEKSEVEGEALLLYEQALHEAADRQLIDVHEMFKRREQFQKVA